MSNTYDQDDQDGSLLALDQYMREVKHLSHLSPDEEAQCFQRLLRARSEPDNQWVGMVARDARDRLVARYLPLVIAIVKKYRWLCHRLDLLDLIQEGNLGLLRALATHQPGEGHDWIVFINLCVHQAVLAAIRDREPMVRLPKNVAREVGWLLAEKRQLEAYQGHEPTVEQLASGMKLPIERVQQLLDWSVFQQVSSIEALVGQEGEEDQMRFMWERTEADVTEQMGQAVRHQAVREAVEALPPRQRQATQLRYGLDGQAQWRDWQEVGELLGLCAKSAASLEYVGRRRLRLSLAWLYEEGQDAEVA